MRQLDAAETEFEISFVKSARNLDLPSQAEMHADIDNRREAEDNIPDDYGAIEFQGKYTMDLMALTDYPEFDCAGANQAFFDWKKHKKQDIMTFRNNSYRSVMTGTVAPVHHTPWVEALDDTTVAVSTVLAAGAVLSLLRSSSAGALTPETLLPLLAAMIVASASTWLRPVTSGTMTITGPVETSMLTGSPRAATVPPAGFWLITSPAGTVPLGAMVTVPTVRPAATIAASASTWAKLTASGVGVSAGGGVKSATLSWFSPSTAV